MPRRFSAHLVASLACSLVTLTTFSSSLVAQAAETASLTRSSEAPALVQAALDAELAGDPARRAALLAEALQADPDFAPARWHNGQVKFDGQWCQLEDVQELVAKDPRWIGYRALREQLGLDHLALAEYCRQHDLDIEGRYHWTNVLLADPRNKAARAYLRIQEHRGRLFTGEQVAAMERWEKDSEANLKRHRPEMAKLCRDATHSDAAARAAALTKIGALDDPAAMVALEEAAEKACERAPRFADDLHQAVVAALGNMPQHEATLRLLNHAVYADSPIVAQAAAQALRPRAQTDYVPLLMAALRAPIEVEYDILATPDGSVRISETFHWAGPQAERNHTQQTNLVTEGALRYDPNSSSPAAVLRGNLDRAATQLARTEARIEAANANAEAMNRRIADVLRVATGDEVSEGATAYWEHWESFNELQSLEDDAVISTRGESNFVYYYPQGEVQYARETRGATAKQGGVDRKSEPIRRWRNGAPMIGDLRRRGGAPGRFRNGTPISYFSCFVPGTPVWTQEGPVAIESVAIGDFVLAQNPHTGEVAYRPVLATTVGEPTGVVNLQFDKETIGATLGHRFWVNGQGWAMAKHLEPSSQLHSLKGSLELRAVEQAPIVDCYNLTVDEFHTFYVGQSRVLVHDSTCPEAELASIPGSNTPRAWTPPIARSPVSIDR